MSENGAYEGPAIVELMGHRWLAGHVSEVEMFGTKMLRVDVAQADGTAATQLYGGGAIYCLTPTTEEMVQKILQEHGYGQASPTSLAALHAAWFEQLSRNQWTILEPLIEDYPGDHSREELAELAGMSPRSSAYGAHLSTLKSLGLVEYPRPGRVRAGDVLFPEGLR